ncbi:MAG: methyltransferase [Alphaproteobacteria bacterium]|nr:methyltransferase [Alphaproteobacteria bacterium]
MDGELALHLDSIQAPLNYLLPMTEKPYAYAYEPPPGRPQRSGAYAEQTVTIRNGRKAADRLSLDREGFVLRRHATDVVDFYDAAEVKRVYFAEVERLVLAETGAKRVVVFDHNLRNAALAQQGVKGLKQPVGRIHNDFTARSGPERARAELGAEADRWLEGRFALVNVWRPITGPVEDWPLALADASSIDAKDWVATDLIYPDRVGETYAVTHNPAHRWFYFPRMRRDEAILIKVYDSDTSRARFSAHTAFHEPSASPNAAPRESIEVRTIAQFG